MFKGPFPLSTYGFTTKGSIKSIIEALFFSVIAMAVITFAKWVFIQYYPPMYGMGLFTPFASYAANFDFDFNFNFDFDFAPLAVEVLILGVVGQPVDAA